jgi:ribonuclease D
MPQTNKVRAIDTETIGEPSYFNKKDKSKIDHRGHPRGFKAQIVTEADDSQAAIFDPPFGDLKITPPERIVFHNACFDLHVLLTSGLLAMSDIRNLGIEDTRIMLKLLNYDSAALKDAAENILGAKVMQLRTPN